MYIKREDIPGKKTAGAATPGGTSQKSTKAQVQSPLGTGAKAQAQELVGAGDEVRAQSMEQSRAQAQGQAQGQAAASEAASVSVPAAYTPSQYKESESVKSAHEALSGLTAPEAYTSAYNERIDAIMDEILNRKPFSYDFNGDALYNQYRDEYTRLGKLAMDDTVTRANAATGGFGNSYAVTAGNQAYQSYLAKLSDIMPELYDAAYRRYADEGTALKEKYALLSDAEANEYGRYRDMLGDYLNERAYLTDIYNSERAFDYGKWSDEESAKFQKWRADVGDAQYTDQFAYQKDRDTVSDEWRKKEWDYGVEQDALDRDYRERTTKEESAQWWANYNLQKSQADREAALSEAAIRAELGDYSGYTSVTGIPKEQIAAHFAKGNFASDLENEIYMAQLTGDTTALKEFLANNGYSADNVDAMFTTQTSPYGDYTAAEFYDLMKNTATSGSFTNDGGMDAAKALVASAGGSDEAWAMYEAMFGPRYTVPDSAFGDTEEDIKANKDTYKKRDFDAVANGGELISEDEWNKAKTMGNKSEVITYFDSYEDYRTAFLGK